MKRTDHRHPMIAALGWFLVLILFLGLVAPRLAGSIMEPISRAFEIAHRFFF